MTAAPSTNGCCWRSATRSSPSETACYYDNSIPDLDAEARFAGCEARCRVDVHLPTGELAMGGDEARSVLLYVHGGTWRVGDRRSMLFSGQHYALAQYHDAVVLSVGYRRSRMPWPVFLGLYPVRTTQLAAVHNPLAPFHLSDTPCACDVANTSW